MANYLIQDTTLTGIAEAIRSKTGGTDPIKVSDMAAQIRDISGGGGSLPAGVYWRHLPIGPTAYSNTHFVYKGELYAFARASSSDNTCTIYKCDDGVYTQLVTFAPNNSFLPDHASIVELNGRVHFICGDHTFHYIWDGAETVKSVTIPYYAGPNAATVYNGVMYAQCNSGATKFMKWDDDNETWSTMTLSGTAPSGTVYLFVYGGNLYGLQSAGGKLFLIDGGAKTSTVVETFALHRSGLTQLIGKYLYFIENGYGASAYKLIRRYDMETKALVALPGHCPELTNSPVSYQYNGEYRISNYREHLVMYDLSATE